MVKWKAAGVVNTGMLKPGAVVTEVQKALGNPQVQRPGGLIDKFTQDTHPRCWKRYGVRPAGGSKTPTATVERYCVDDEPHKDYLYTPAWVAYLIEKMNSARGVRVALQEVDWGH